MVGHHRLDAFHYDNDQDGLGRLLHDLRCIQLDPLAPLGSSPDLVAAARCRNYTMGDLFKHILPEYGFEHFAKERCLLPLKMFPYYQSYAQQGMWPRLRGWLNKNIPKVPQAVLDGVLQDIADNGPMTPSEMADHGQVVPMDWQGWKGTAKATTMALEILWARCQVIVCGRKGREKVYGLPQQFVDLSSLPDAADFFREALLARVDAAGLLPRNSGPHWSMLNEVRKGALVDSLLEEGLLVECVVAGASRKYLARAGFAERAHGEPDEAMRILGPLDALLWYRPLVADIFDFTYVWEVYKPAKDRMWGWYVCPLLHQGHLVGRLQGKAKGDTLVIDTVWREQNRDLDRTALRSALKRHIAAMGLNRFVLPKRFRAPVKT